MIAAYIKIAAIFQASARNSAELVSFFLLEKARHPMKKEIFAMVGLGGRPVRVNSPGLSDANKCRSASRHSCESVFAKLGSLGSLTSKQPWLRQADATSSVRGRSGLPARTGLPNAPSSSRFIIFSESIRVWVRWTGQEILSEERCPRRWTSRAPRVPSPSAP